MLVPQKETIRIVDEIDVVVPSSNSLMTPFVLKEQGDWFEDEIKFIRRFIKSDMNVIDIGANYGLYTLSCARKIDKNGKLWAFEPTPSVAECLRDSIEKNKFSNINLIEAGLSNRSGEARLAINPNAELNSLNTPIDENSKFETIVLKTLDECMEEFNWHAIDFIKLDAEGEEVRILEGGKNCLEKLSPVIMYELKHGEQVNKPLITKFEEFGYKSYYLIPGPMVLLPFSLDIEMDSFQLNLFAMKDSTAKLLMDNGFLSFNVQEFDFEIDGNLWIDELQKKEFSIGLIDKWTSYIEKNIKEQSVELYINAVNAYTYATLDENSSQDRLDALFLSYNILRDLLSQDAPLSVSIMYVRVLLEIGERAKAVKMLGNLISQLSKGAGVSLSLPFYPVFESYEHKKSEGSLANWLFSSLLEPFELKKSFSSYFSGKQSLGNLQSLKKLGFCSDEVDRRIELLQTV